MVGYVRFGAGMLVPLQGAAVRKVLLEGAAVRVACCAF